MVGFPPVLILVVIVGLGLVASPWVLEARGQRPRVEEPSRWEYKVGVLSYNPGERLTDDQRAAQYERSLNEQSAKGWELVGAVLDRDSVQTVGGAVTTRDTVSFIAFRRPKR